MAHLEPVYRQDMIAGRYVLADRIGRGAMGTVWRVFDLRTQSWLAAKVLGLADSEAMVRFTREQAVRIAHPHVLTPNGWAAEDDTAVFTMPLVRGGSLADLARPLPLGFVVELLDQLLQGLVAVHAAGVVHRDVKPANLLLEATGVRRPRARLTDFGVASPTSARGVVGTKPYASPEQEAGLAPDPRDDVYSVGVLALRLVADPGRLQPWIGDLTAARDRRPTAIEALASLRGLEIPFEEGPPIPDRLGEVAVPLEASLGLARRRRAGIRVRLLLACGCFTGAIGLAAAAATRVLAQ